MRFLKNEKKSRTWMKKAGTERDALDCSREWREGAKDTTQEVVNLFREKTGSGLWYREFVKLEGKVGLVVLAEVEQSKSMRPLAVR